MRVRISLLYVEDCPSWQLAESRLAEALRLLGRPDQQVERVRVATDAQAQAWRFRGSPTILVDGEDPFHVGGPGAYGLSCRLYATDAGLAGAPTVDDLLVALAART